MKGDVSLSSDAEFGGMISVAIEASLTWAKNSIAHNGSIKLFNRGIINFTNDNIDLGNNCYEIFSMEIIKYYNFKEFAICGLRSGKLLGVDIANKKIPPPLELDDIRKTTIPLFPLSFQQEIETLVKTSHKHLEESKALYAKAEALLYAELGLNPHNPLDFIEQKSSGSLNISVRTLKQSFLATGRLDSEYYQNKYDEIERVIKNYQGGYGKISDYFKQNKKSKSFTLPEYKYIEIGDINTGTGTANYNIIQTNDLPANAKIFLNNGDLLISKVRPNRGAVAIVNFDENDLIGSGAFCVLPYALW